MCGIAGMIGLPYDDIICRAMLGKMHHRGPDANGIVCAQDVCLLHTRLSIVDPDGGAQPMQIRWHGETYTITYNGELYNSAELRDLLLRLGHSFHGHSDTEIVLHAYAQWDEGCLDRLNGIFSFAIWEHKRRKLFLARDRAGVKPLFYMLHNSGMLFASEVKAILAYPSVKAQLDSDGIAEVFLLGPGRTPGCGILKGICELEAGCCGYYFLGKWNWKRYWKLRDRVHTDSLPETAEKVEYLVTDAIRRQMVADVPIGTFLSGGLDSSLISSVCAQETASRGERLRTFSVDYLDNDIYFVPGKFQPQSDTEYINAMIDHIGSEHTWSVLTPEELVDSLEESVIARDFPGMADVDSSLLVFCKRIRQDVKVALSGECADEIFGGYPWFRDPDVRSVDGFPWAQNNQQRISLLKPNILRNDEPEDYIHNRYEKTIQWADILPDTDKTERRMKEMMVLNMRWFMQTLLDRKDRMSMHCGLEVRVPFCDYRIIEYLYGVPWEYKNYNGQEKGLLRKAMAKYLPEKVLHRKKSPYPKTHDPHYTELVVKRFNYLLETKNAPIFEILQREKVRDLLEADYKWPWYGQLMKKPQTLAFILQANFWLTHNHIDILI